MKPLRFCMITTFYSPYAFGGDAVFVYRLTNMHARGGYEVDVIHCVDSYHVLDGTHLKLIADGTEVASVEKERPIGGRADPRGVRSSREHYCALFWVHAKGAEPARSSIPDPK